MFGRLAKEGIVTGTIATPDIGDNRAFGLVAESTTGLASEVVGKSSMRRVGREKESVSASQGQKKTLGNGGNGFALCSTRLDEEEQVGIVALGVRSMERIIIRHRASCACEGREKEHVALGVGCSQRHEVAKEKRKVGIVDVVCDAEIVLFGRS